MAGPITVLGYAIVWFALLWAGWGLVFASGDETVLRSPAMQPADLSGLLYFVGFTIITLGVGDYVPQGSLWQMLTVIASLSGFFMITMLITYVIALLSAVVNARAFASQVTGLGQTPEAFVVAGWNGGNLHALDLPLNTLASSLAGLSQRYLAYPLLYHYHAIQRSDSPAVALGILDEALTLMRFGIRPEVQPAVAVLETARASVASFLAALPEEESRSAAEHEQTLLGLEELDLENLRNQGISTINEADFRTALEALSERRCQLRWLLHNDGRE